MQSQTKAGAKPNPALLTQAAQIVNPTVVSYVKTYLMLRAYTEAMTERVEKIEAEILAECPIVIGNRWNSPRAGEPITKGNDLYLAGDDQDAEIQDFYAETNKRLRAQGIKPADMDDDHCPALVAHHAQIAAESALINASGEPLGVSTDNLWSMEKRAQWIELVVGLIVNHTDFKNPLTGEGMEATK